VKILVDIGHPAHVHFFHHPISLWRRHGHHVIVTSRRKEVAVDLLDALQVPHRVLSTQSKGVGGLARELLRRNHRLLRLIRQERPDVMAGIGGVYIAQTGFLSRTPSVVFYDTENAALSNAMTYPFCSLVVVPACYQGWLPPWHLRYPGYHELSYLREKYFQPDRDKALRAGLDPRRPTFLIRTVSWQASHDLLEQGWTPRLLREITAFLERTGKVIISAEGDLPGDLASCQYRGRPQDLHHLMAYLSMFIGESATMASECAVLGVPAVYAAQTGRGYTDEQEKKYGLVRNLRVLTWEHIRPVIEDILSAPEDHWRRKRRALLRDTVDVCRFVADLIERYPASVRRYRSLFRGDGHSAASP